MPSYEICLPGNEWHGLFTYSFCKVLGENPKITIKDIIFKTNIEMKKSGLDQTSEVICRQNHLDLNIFKGKHPKEKIALFQFDMCRTIGEWGLQIENK